MDSQPHRSPRCTLESECEDHLATENRTQRPSSHEGGHACVEEKQGRQRRGELR